MYLEEEVVMEDEPDRQELYVPKWPIKFDKSGKILLYEYGKSMQSAKKYYFTGAALSCIPQYLFMRACMRLSWWRMILWGIPSLITFQMQRNVYKLSSRTVSRMYLMKDGETVIIETILRD